jgi:hypothetical protein
MLSRQYMPVMRLLGVTGFTRDTPCEEYPPFILTFTIHSGELTTILCFALASQGCVSEFSLNSNCPYPWVTIPK